MIKTLIKYPLSRWGVFQFFDMLRRTPETIRWIKTGCKGPAPPPLKRIVIKSYLRHYGLEEFIETGTYLGDTLAYIANTQTVRCTSIELSDNYYKQALRRFFSWPNVTVLYGDSSTLLPEIVRQLNQPALFWLDGHHSGTNTAQGKINTPINQELKAILDSPIKTHVILIDDAHCFNGTNGYPQLDELLKVVRTYSNYIIEVSVDIIRMTSKHLI